MVRVHPSATRLDRVRLALSRSSGTMPLVTAAPAASAAADVLVASRSRWGKPPARPDGASVCKVASLLPLTPEYIARLESCAPSGVTVEVVALTQAASEQLRTHNQPVSDNLAIVAEAVEEIDAAIDGAEVWFGAFWDLVPGSRQLEATRFPPSLRWLCVSQAGAGQVTTYLQEEAKELDSLFVTNVSGMHARWIGEWVIGFMSAHCMRLPVFLEQQKVGHWGKQRTANINGSTVLVVGLGAIGEEVSRLCKAFGATVLGTRRGVAVASAFPPNVRNAPCDELHPASALHELLPRADFVILATPGTAETEALIGAAELGLMKSTAALINVSRGATVDFAALGECLRGGGIAACYSDVAPTEPLPADDPLWAVPNLFFTPHNSGNPDGVGGAGERYMKASIEYFAAQLSRYLKGEKIFNRVDNSLGY